MPDLTQSEALRKLRTSFPPNVREIETVTFRQRRQDVADELDLVFVVDITASMSDAVADIAEALADVAAGIDAEFPSVKYAVVSFKDEDATEVVTGASLVSLSTAQAALDGLTTGGGGDTPDNGFGALHAAAKLPFRDEAARAIVFISDSTSHSRGKSLLAAKNALLLNRVFVFYGFGADDETGYDLIVEATGGSKLAGGTVEQIGNQITNALKGIADPVAAPIYLVNDNGENLIANLEDGSEKEFQCRRFSINPFTSGEDGALEISMTVDNSDFAVSKYLAKAKNHAIPLEVTFRIYKSDNLTTPQNLPTLTLFATDFETRGALVSCKLRWIDLQNSKFPNAFYTPTICPSLQGT